MNNNYENLDEIKNMAVGSLQENGVFMMENFLDKDICKSVSNKVIDLVDNKIDKTLTKEYDDYIVLDPDDENRGSNWMDAQSKSVINMRGNHGANIYDTGFCDIFNPDLLFEEIKELKNNDFFKGISSMFGKDPERNYCNIYYNDGIIDTRGWHKDAPMVKLFVYLTDVKSEDYGPYCYISKSHKSDWNIKNIEGYEYNSNDMNKFIAPAGTLIGSYQHGFHRGLPQPKGFKRVLLVYKIYLNN